MRTSEIVKYYSNKDVRDKILELAKGREVAPKFSNGSFGERPQILQFDRELFDYVRNGVSSFHASEERWLNPAQLNTGMSRRDMNRIRKGWDLILDIDTKNLEYAKICAELLVEALEFHDIKCFSYRNTF
jgi:DNA primase catalytic subunit